MMSMKTVRMSDWLVAALVCLLAAAACDRFEQTARDDHAGHDHGEPGVESAHDEDDAVELGAESEHLAGIALATAATGTLSLQIIVPGEVGFNEDRLAHVAPRFEGIVKQVSQHVGSRVKAGDEMALIESNASLSEYAVHAPIAGTIIDKHVTQGEFVSQDAQLFTIADLTTVWVNLEVPAKHAGTVKKGQEVSISTIGSELEATGTIDYAAPILRQGTRSGLARIALPNRDGIWRPGTFVTGHIRLRGAGEAGQHVVVNNEAIQVLDGKKIVFIPAEPGSYQAVPVRTGLSDRRHTEVLAGLEPGARYVCTGAFELKAEIAVSTLGGHAGHGH